jgi:hypothetical protein
MHWRQVGNYPVGRLGVPLDYYARFAKAMHYAREKKDPGIFLAEAGNYVNRAAEVLSSASHDRFHWLKLESTIRPAEPEAVAMTTAMAIISHSMFNTSIREMPHLDEHGRLLVEVGDDMWRAAQRPDEGQR